MLPVGRTSNSPEAVHSHLKDQSQWSHQAHLFLPPLLRVGPSVQLREYYSWVASDVTKNQTKKLSILLSFYFHEVLPVSYTHLTLPTSDLV